MSKAEDLIAQQGWTSRPSGDGSNLAVETCVFCQNTNWKFYVNVTEEKDGLFKCMVCDKQGNLWQLKNELGLTTPNVTSVKDAAPKDVQPLPDLMAMHRMLLTSEAYGDILDYLVAGRGFSMAVIEKFKLGGYIDQGQKFMIIPYLDAAGKPVFYKGRSLPVEGQKKKYLAPSGREARMFNDTAITDGMDELVMLEGEADCLALLSQGYESCVGIPGASVKKAAWLERLDQAKPKNIYLCYDLDEAGQKNAKEMASRIGFDKVRNVVLPAFLTKEGTKAKDLNEWFCTGKTLADFRELMSQAKKFDIQGVQSVGEILSDLRSDIEDKGNAPMYDTPWPSLTNRVGGFENGDLVGLMAEGKIGKTTMALNICQYYASKGIVPFMFCQEMPPKRMVRKWVSHVTGTDDSPGKSQITPEVVDKALEVALAMPGDILFGFTSSNKADDIFDTVRQTVRRYGVKVVVFDNLQMMVATLDTAAQETSKITKGWKKLAMELDVLIILIIQPKRVADGMIISSRDAMGSSAIEKDVDFMICLHRNRVLSRLREEDFKGVMDTEDTFEPELLVKVDLGRYCAGGSCTLYMDGATSTVRELGDKTTQSTEPAQLVAV